MKKTAIISLLCLTLLYCERWGGRGEPCISADKTEVTTGETVTISNCGDELPSAYVDTEIDWGDGTITSGQTGSHSYESNGVYVVKLILNGSEATELVDVDESDVVLEITVQ